MLPFGHLGIGSQLVRPWSKGLPKKWLLLGTLLPDLIDKPLYYALVLATGRHGAELGLISGTRTFGHSAIFLLTLMAAAVYRRSRALAALVLGVATHLALDGVTDIFTSIGQHHAGPSFIVTLLFPLYGARFQVAPFHSAMEHLREATHPFIIGSEIVGILILGWQAWKSQHRNEILAMLQLNRHRRRRRKLLKKQARATPHPDHLL